MKTTTRKQIFAELEKISSAASVIENLADDDYSELRDAAEDEEGGVDEAAVDEAAAFLEHAQDFNSSVDDLVVELRENL